MLEETTLESVFFLLIVSLPDYCENGVIFEISHVQEVNSSARTSSNDDNYICNKSIPDKYSVCHVKDFLLNLLTNFNLNFISFYHVHTATTTLCCRRRITPKKVSACYFRTCKYQPYFSK
jgi:hypothetical protein